MNVLIACEESGVVREAFRALGHNAWSCDIQPSRIPGQHWHGDIRDANFASFDLMIAHPPCTFLSVSGLHWNRRGVMVDGRPRAEHTEEALDFVRFLMGVSVPMIAVENPISCISTRIRKPDQIIQPYDFGEDASKATCLWLKGLPRLRPTLRVDPRMVSGKPRWGNQTDSGQNKLAPSDHRARDRSATYPGIAAAIADQWGRQELRHREAA